ncbi:hypothetical protein JCM33374_g3792 [Metschnikowia sp. JCM 33374]|nr:hypothetical protein JCM33374_g3792 [Metschnikowia sp. JCM 33374]
MGGNGTDPYFEATEVPKMIERFVSRLKRFVFRGVFNVPAFEYESDDLQTELTQIIGAMKSTDPTEELLGQLRHAKGVFSKMSGSVADLKHYNLSDLPGHEWVYKIIQLNLHLLMMYDSLGNLDTSIPGYVQHVFYSWRNIHVWGMNLRQLNHVPKEIRMLYESQAATAQATINILGEQMSEDSVIETELLHC